MENTFVLQMWNIRKTFPGVIALDNVSFDLLCGEGNAFGTLIEALIIGDLRNGLTLLNIVPSRNKLSSAWSSLSPCCWI